MTIDSNKDQLIHFINMNYISLPKAHATRNIT